tara:strand:- start:50 stop:358 length:309 start_codon:yes stop_codon:yes gene_type:complete
MRESIKAYSKQKSIVKKALRDANFEDIKLSNGHYFFSGFAKKNNKIIYYSISDVRFFKSNTGADVLIRTAKDYKDYTGGVNNYCSMNINDIKELANKLTQNK